MKLEIIEINALWLKQAGDRMTIRPEALLNGILHHLRTRDGEGSGESDSGKWLEAAGSTHLMTEDILANLRQTRVIVEEAARGTRLYISRIESERNPVGPRPKVEHLTHPKPQPQLVKIPIEMPISRLGEGSNVMWVRPQAFPPHMQTALISSSTFSNAGEDFHIVALPFMSKIHCPATIRQGVDRTRRVFTARMRQRTAGSAFRVASPSARWLRE